MVFAGCGLSGFLDPVATEEDERAREAMYAAFDALAPVSGVFRAQELAPFAWDQLHVFGGYQTDEMIRESTHTDWREAPREVPEGASLLVFVKDRQVVSAFYLDRPSPAFTCLGHTKPLRPYTELRTTRRSTSDIFLRVLRGRDDCDEVDNQPVLGR